MHTYDLILSRRTIRRYQQDQRIGRNLLFKMLNAARMAPSAANLQPLKYRVVDSVAECAALFQHTRWAGYLPVDVGTPPEGAKPSAYFIVLADTRIHHVGYDIDLGAAAQNITLTALEQGIACCWFGALDRDGIRKTFEIPDYFTIPLVIALGYPAEQSVPEDLEDSVKYYKDEAGNLHVPKRRLEDVIYE